MKRIDNTRWISCLLLLLFLISSVSLAQNWRRTPTPSDTLKSVKILAENKILFRLYAPNATDVKLGGSDIPNMGEGTVMTKRSDGVWEVTLGPQAPGAYRYVFNVDGVSAVDPKSASVSESNGNVWSLMYVPGADFMEVKNLPHGAVSAVTYYSTSLKRFRRMHVYTPPGYESGQGTYPVFYLLHGAFDCDDSWTTVGRAGFILDNLFAEKKALPMVVVMPAGHAGPFRFRAPGGGSSEPQVDEFTQDFITDIMPYVETNYRILADQKHRAIAGLSMGGAQTLNIAFIDPAKFSFIGVYSSGIFGIAGGSFGDSSGPSWEEQHKAVLDNAEWKKGLALVWFATGADDFLIETSRATVAMLKTHGLNVTYKESAGGHTWSNWRDYLCEFAPQLFK
jgi:enterochelin esterase-like enzyme